MKITASPLYYVESNPQLALVPAANESLGLVLDPALHLRQRAFEDRAKSFRGLSWGGSPKAFDPELDPLSGAEVIGLAVEPIEAQRRRGATLLLTSAHLVGGIGTRGRELDLALARIGIEHFQREGMHEPPEDALNPVERQIFATITLPVEALRVASERSAMVAAYAELAANGFWVRIAGFSEQAPLRDIEAGGAFLAELRDAGRAVVVDQPGQLGLALLADGLSVAMGFAEGERFSYPTNWRRATAEREHRGRLRTAYHPKFMRSFQLRGEPARRAFRASPCRCRRHQAAEPPDGRCVEPHAAIVRCEQATEALQGEPEERREWLLAHAAMAGHAGREAGVDVTPATVFEALFRGLDRLDQQERGSAGA